MRPAFLDSKELPLIVRVSGEHHDATTPLTRTSSNYESVLVAHSGDCSIRIAVDGYRVLKRTRPDFWSTIQSSRVSGLGLQNKASVYALLDTLQNDAIFSPADVAGAKAASEAWPESAQTAWTRVHGQDADRTFAPHITAALIPYMHGV